MDQRLIQAAQSGNIDTLYILIQENPQILEEVEQVPFIDTPLHVAAASGHVPFAMEMMNLKASFAKKLNPNGFSPMHLALAKEQTPIVLELLKVDSSLIRVKGREGMTPMHYAVKEGNLDLLAEFLLACPECFRDATVQGETALHIAVMSEKFEALELLTGWLQRMAQKDARFLEIQVLNRRDHEGNTVLHLAAYRNQPQAIRLLLGCWAANRNIQNKSGLTALDILENQRQHINEDIKQLVQKSGGLRATSLPKIKTLADFLQSKITFFQYFFTYIARKRNNVSAETRNALLVVAALIITATYQTALSPPGGLWQGEGSNSTDTKNVDRVGGTVVMSACYFYLIWVSNSIAFWSTLVLTAVLLPGGTYTKLLLWTLLFLCVSYTVSMLVISPGRSLNTLSMNFLVFCALGICVMLSLIVNWRKAVLRMIPEPRSELILEGLTTLRLARGAQ